MDITFDNLLVILGITEDDYILAIISSISTPTVFLKRSPNELSIVTVSHVLVHGEPIWIFNLY